MGAIGTAFADKDGHDRLGARTNAAGSELKHGWAANLARKPAQTLDMWHLPDWTRDSVTTSIVTARPTNRPKA